MRKLGYRKQAYLETMTPIIITPAAERDIAEAADWYNAISVDLSFDFRKHLNELFQRIIEHPEAYSSIAQGMRRALLRRFSYAVYIATTGKRSKSFLCYIPAVIPTLGNREIINE